MAVVVNGFVVNKVSFGISVHVNGQRLNTKFRVSPIVLNDSVDWKKQQKLVRRWNSKLFYSEDGFECYKFILDQLARELVESPKDFTSSARTKRNDDIQYHRMDDFGVIDKNKIATARVAKVQNVNYINPEHKKSVRVFPTSCLLSDREKIINEDKLKQENESINTFIDYINKNLEKEKINKFKVYILDLFEKDKSNNKLSYLYIRIKQLTKNKEIQFYCEERLVRRIPIYF